MFGHTALDLNLRRNDRPLSDMMDETVRLPKARGAPAQETRSLRKAASLLPFERLPNLPSPVIPVIDLGIGSRADIRAIE